MDKITKLHLDGETYEIGNCLPEGGTAGQVLTKTDGGAEWGDPAPGGDGTLLYFEVNQYGQVTEKGKEAVAKIKELSTAAEPFSVAFGQEGVSSTSAIGFMDGDDVVIIIPGVTDETGNIEVTQFKINSNTYAFRQEVIEAPSKEAFESLTSKVNQLIPTGGTAGQVLKKTSKGTEWRTIFPIDEAITVGKNNSNVSNGFLHRRSLPTGTAGVVTGTLHNGAAFGVKLDGTASFQHKTYANGSYGGAKNTAVMTFSGASGLKFAVNTGSGNDPSADMYHDVLVDQTQYPSLQTNAKDIIGAINELYGLIQNLNK